MTPAERVAVLAALLVLLVLSLRPILFRLADRHRYHRLVCKQHRNDHDEGKHDD
jgi:hypothetical protein